jgi:hypothetical protein
VERVGVVSDTGYWDYSVRLFRLYDACRDHGRNVTTKTLDAYLLAVPLWTLIVAFRPVCSNCLSAADDLGWDVRNLRPMPCRNHPDSPALHAVEEAVRVDNDFAELEIRELRNHATRVGEVPEAGKHGIHSVLECPGGRRSVRADVGESRQELGAGGRRETDPQRHDSSSSASASAITVSRS